MPHQVLQASTLGFYVFADDAESFGNGLAGLSLTVLLSKAGGPFLAVAPAIADLGGGIYWVTPLAAHRDTLGEIAWRFEADGAVIAPRFERVGVVSDQTPAWGANTIAPDNAAIGDARIAAAAAAGVLEALTELDDEQLRLTAKALELAGVDLQPVLDAIAESEGADSAQIAADVLAGLESVQITRIGPEFDPETSTVTLIAGDDYLVDNDAALTFGLTLPGIDLAGATAVFSAETTYAPVLIGTAELLDTDTDQPKLRLTWTREQTLAKPSDRYAWGAAIIDSAGLVKTIIGGPLILKPPAVNPAVVAKQLEAAS